jgi:hypothetical protein
MKKNDNPKYDLAVCYRIYPKVSSHAPPIFKDDKFKLSKLCYESFKASLGNLKVKLWVLLDNCPSAYEEMFSSIWPAEDLVLMRYPGVGDASTFREQARILMEQNDAEIVYLAEDDYFYLPDEFPLAVRFIKENPDVDFVTAYDHPDIYTLALHKIPYQTKTVEGKTWRTCMSTTHTFLTTRTTLRKCGWVFLASYGKVSPDLTKWMALTKKRIFNPFFFVRSVFTCPFWAASVYFAWRYCLRQVLFGKKYNLWMPKPTIATHMVAGMESSGVDWKKIFADKCTSVNSPK